MNRNKSFVFFSSLLFLSMGMTACSGTPVNLGNGRDGVEPLMPTPDDDSDGGGDPSCTYDEHEYASGETFPSTDGCNTCTCDEGAIACTERACDPELNGTCSYGGSVYADGATFPAEDGCNTCGCESGMVACTEIGCVPSTGGCDLGGVHYNNGDQIPSMDCNSMWCQDGMIASTLVFCPTTGDCSYEGQEYALGESFTSAGGLTVCTCEMDGLQCETEDMCTASVRLCEENGGDPMACAAMYAGCMPQAPTFDVCADALTACKLVDPSTYGMLGIPPDCDAQYVSCTELQAMPFWCDAAQVNCLEADPTDANGQCSQGYQRCAGGLDPANPYAECGLKLDSCRTDGGMNCVAEYITCVGTDETCGDLVLSAPEQCDDGNRSDGDGCSAFCKLEPAACELDGIVYRDGAEVPSSDCNTQYCVAGMIITTMVACPDGGAAN